MEVMEDGNLMDRIRILIQRDLQYYQDKQTVLQNSICPGVVGGKLDFPRNASFASVKLVLWLEEEYLAAYRKNSGLTSTQSDQDENRLDNDVSVGCGGVVKTSDPKKFVSMVSKCSEQLLEHLHVLSQEALDHADLAVLTGTIGASSLVKNCIWCYMQTAEDSSPSADPDGGSLQASHRQYAEMAEALAERLLDLHCRLLSLYIIQDAESLDWENPQSFFETERGSFTIQMWWFYMFGTKNDLWSSVPPKIAQRVFSGMLNESLTILSVRYTQARPSKSRSRLLIVDISNLLLCVMNLMSSICDSVEQFLGLSIHSQNKLIRDVHAKCNELLVCFLLRGTPLDILHKIFKNGFDNVTILKPRTGNPCPWLYLTAPKLFLAHNNRPIRKMEDLSSSAAIALELRVLLSQPQSSWADLLKILLMRNLHVAQIILNYLIPRCKQKVANFKIYDEQLEDCLCGGFLCTGDGLCQYPQVPGMTIEVFHVHLEIAVVYILTLVGSKMQIKLALLPALELSANHQWAVCLDRQQIWNINKPPWLVAVMIPLNPVLPSIVHTTIAAVRTGASLYQAMSLAIACFQQMWHCVPTSVAHVAALLTEILPADIRPLADSVIFQILISALYKEFYDKISDKHGDTPKLDERGNNANASTDSIAHALAEALCTIDEDNKHTEQIDDFLQEIADLEAEDLAQNFNLEQSKHIADVMSSEILMSFEGKLSFKVLDHFVKHNNGWLLNRLNWTWSDTSNEQAEPNHLRTEDLPFLYHAFHIGDKPFDQILSAEWQPDWVKLFSIPMGLTTDRVWNHISLRWEFRNDSNEELSVHDAAVVEAITTQFKQL